MTASIRFSTSVLFGPEALHEMAVAYENVCATIPKRLQTRALRETVARLVIMHAAAGNSDSVQLYLICLSALRAGWQLPI
jgi:hypothetical protein